MVALSKTFSVRTTIFSGPGLGIEMLSEFICANKPMMLGTTVGAHGTHVMAVTGYRYYTRTSRFLWWTTTEWRTILKVFDGSVFSCFDITQYFSIPFSFGCLIKYVW